MTEEELVSQILSDLHEGFNNKKKINLFKRIADTIDFYLQSELRDLREQEFELNKEQVLTLIEQAQILGELQGLLKVGK